MAPTATYVRSRLAGRSRFCCAGRAASPLNYESGVRSSNLLGRATLRFCTKSLPIGAQAPHQAADTRTRNLLPVASAQRRSVFVLGTRSRLREGLGIGCVYRKPHPSLMA